MLTGFDVKVFDGYRASYIPANHYVGKIKVLGFSHTNRKADGRAALDAYVGYLAMHPSTAKRIATRLCMRFVGLD